MPFDATGFCRAQQLSAGIPRRRVCDDDGFSWNCKPPSGYEVVRIRFKDGEPVSIEPFVTGFLIEQPDGTGAGSRGRLGLRSRRTAAC